MYEPPTRRSFLITSGCTVTTAAFRVKGAIIAHERVALLIVDLCRVVIMCSKAMILLKASPSARSVIGPLHTKYRSQGRQIFAENERRDLAPERDLLAQLDQFAKELVC